MIVPNNPNQSHWYPMIEHRPAPLQPLRILPIFEEDESGFSVDVLVFGYIYDKGTEYPNIPCFALGYVNRKGDWSFYTVNGAYPDANNPITDFAPLMWQYLPADPCDVPSVKDSPISQDIEPLSNAVGSPDPMTSLYTKYGGL